VLRHADRGDLTIRAAPSPDLERQINQLERTVVRLSAAVVFAGLAVSGAILYTAGEHTIGAAGFALAGLTLLRVISGR
jgi:hypothetical protein